MAQPSVWMCSAELGTSCLLLVVLFVVVVFLLNRVVSVPVWLLWPSAAQMEVASLAFKTFTSVAKGKVVKSQNTK